MSTSAEKTGIAPPARLYRSVIDDIIERISVERLQPGDALPTERELATALGVSRNVLREAFRVLEERGLIVTRQGAGRFVRELLPGEEWARFSQRDLLERASIADVLEARIVLEQQVVLLACQRRTTEEARHLCEIAEKLDTWQDNLRFHRSIAKATHNFMLERMVEEQLMLLNELDQRGHYPAGRADAVIAIQLVEHKNIAIAILERDEDEAQQLIRDHLRRARKAVVQNPSPAGARASDQPA